mmetsp:Transcript_38185/g.96992  ORF Transcript_38185/g.96992 Transcript_38185/m.96992 type:complete len:211 (+) Transcript_38185:2462-3094(+)
MAMRYQGCGSGWLARKWSVISPETSSGAACIKAPLTRHSRASEASSCSLFCTAATMYPPCDPPISHTSGGRSVRYAHRPERARSTPRSSSSTTVESARWFMYAWWRALELPRPRSSGAMTTKPSCASSASSVVAPSGLVTSPSAPAETVRESAAARRLSLPCSQRKMPRRAPARPRASSAPPPPPSPSPPTTASASSPEAVYSTPPTVTR